MFLRIPKLLSEDQLTTVRQALGGAAAPWVDGRVTAGHQGAPVKKNQQIEEASAAARELGGLVVAELERNPLFISAVLPHRVYPPVFNRYGEGMQFGTHVDGAVRMIPGTGQKLRTDLSATLFLAPPESYEGGELIIESDFGRETVKLAAGRRDRLHLDVAAPRESRDSRHAPRLRVLDSELDSRRSAA